MGIGIALVVCIIVFEISWFVYVQWLSPDRNRKNNMADKQRVQINDRVFTVRDGNGTVMDIIFADRRSAQYGILSTTVDSIDVTFDNGMVKYVLPHMLKVIDS